MVICEKLSDPMKSPNFIDIEPTGKDNEVLNEVVISTLFMSISALKSQLTSTTHKVARICTKMDDVDFIV